MSILKSILHRWNSTNKEYDTLHPETESSQITDWHTGIMNSLASKTLGTVVSSLTTDSVFGKLMRLLLSASGVKYSLGTNGYVKFGSFFGGLIIQWGYLQINNGNGILSLPLSCTLLGIHFQHHGSSPQYNGFDKSSMTVYSSLTNAEGLMWIAIGA